MYLAVVITKPYFNVSAARNDKLKALNEQVKSLLESFTTL